MLSAKEKLEKFLAKIPDLAGVEFKQLTSDASTREYFRIYSKRTAIATVYPEPTDPQGQNYLDVTHLFETAGMPVAKIYDVDCELGIIVHQDFGDTILRNVIETASPEKREEWIDLAISMIAYIQLGTHFAYELNSIASRLSFDEEKLSWELNFFKTHYFETLKNTPLNEFDSKAVNAEFTELSRELAGRAKVLTHRDFHAANLMVDNTDGLHIIDHQDARIGTVSYDLVSLLLDRVVEPPTAEWLAEKRRFFLKVRENIPAEIRGDVPFEELDEEDFAYEFRLQTIQRCLKAVGTFSFQSVNRGKTYFLPFIEPMFRIVLRAAENLDRFPHLQRVLTEQVAPPSRRLS
jgi:aminoglycoside/choline kinase family phosphotransferase